MLSKLLEWEEMEEVEKQTTETVVAHGGGRGKGIDLHTCAIETWENLGFFLARPLGDRSVARASFGTNWILADKLS